MQLQLVEGHLRLGRLGAFGGQERHGLGPRRAFALRGAVVAGPETPCVAAVTEALESSGVRLASVTSLPGGRVSGVDAQPQVENSVEARRAAARIANYLAA